MTGVQYPIQDRFEFEYATVARVRAEGLLLATLSDAAVRDKLREVGKIINKATDQWFIPLEYKERVNGAGFHSVRHPSSIPLLSMRGITLYSEGVTTSLTSDQYRVGKRDVFLTGFTDRMVTTYAFRNNTRFPDRPLNVLLDGTFGWVENRPFVGFDQTPTVETTVASVANGATSITVGSTAGFRVRDSIILRQGAAGAAYAGHAIVTAVPNTTTLTVEALRLNSTVTAGTVITYGQVPEAVESAAARLVIRFKSAFNSDSGNQADRASRLIRERTDQYEYQLSQHAATGSSLTGDMEADRLLMHYMAPPILLGVV